VMAALRSASICAQLLMSFGFHAPGSTSTALIRHPS
jgi:hypothetical protein